MQLSSHLDPVNLFSVGVHVLPSCIQWLVKKSAAIGTFVPFGNVGRCVLVKVFLEANLTKFGLFGCVFQENK